MTAPDFATVYPDMQNAEVGRLFGMTPSQVRRLATQMKLQKSAEYRRIDRIRRGKRTSFSGLSDITPRPEPEATPKVFPLIERRALRGNELRQVNSVFALPVVLGVSA